MTTTTTIPIRDMCLNDYPNLRARITIDGDTLIYLGSKQIARAHSETRAWSTTWVQLHAVPTPTDTTAEPTDAELLAAHVAGCPRAFATLYGRYVGHLTTAARQQGSPEPEDAAQVALAKAAQCAAQYPGPGVCAVSTWLHRIIKNVNIDAWRVRKNLPTSALVDDVAAPQGNDPEVARQVRHALATLPLEQAQALELHYLLGLSAVEISTRLRINENTIKGRIRLGIAKMRNAVTETRPDAV